MIEKKLVPKRRFEEFTGEWNIKRLRDLASFSKGRGYSKKDLSSYGNPIILYGHLYTDYKSDIQKVESYAIKKENSVISQGDEVIVPSSGESAKDIARASTVSKSGIILGGDLNIIKPNQTVDSMFLGLSITNSSVQKELIKRVQGSSVVHLYNSDIEEVNLIYPSTNEQQKIGKFFKCLDEMIAFEQRKINKTKALKNAYLTEMFPAEGERVPKRRFEGFDGEWKESKLGDVSKIVGGGTPSTNKKEYWNGKINWYSPAEIGNQIYVSESQRKISQLGFDNSSTNLLPKGAVLFTSRAGIGKTAILKKEGTTNQGFQSIIPIKEKLDTYFIYSLSNELKDYGEKNASGSTFLEISGKEMEKMTINLPSVKEQQKIGQFFKSLDDKITTQERKLEKLKAIKQAYLHEMFV